MEALSTDTVFELKGKIQDKEGVAINDQRLIYAVCSAPNSNQIPRFKGKLMSDDRHLNDYNVYNGTTVHLVYRLLGGGCPTYYIHPSLFDKKHNRSFMGFTVFTEYFSYKDAL